MSNTVESHLTGRANNFDFIRFIAAVAVIFSHSFRLARPGYDEPLRVFSHGKFTIGDISVAVFFIISGLLISQSFDRSKSLLGFIQARVLRIYPALIVTILLTVFVVGPIFTTTPLGHYYINHLTFKYLTNIFCIRMRFYLPGMFAHNFYPDVINGSIWTLPQELSCYGLTIIAGLFLMKKYLHSIIAAIIVGCLYFGHIIINPHTYYFAIGALIYVYRSKIIINGYLAILSFIVLMADLHFNHNFIISVFIAGVALAYLIMYCGFYKNEALRHFAKRGDFSYGIYVWGFVVQQTIALKFPGLNPFSHFLLSSFIALIIAVLSWHLIEKNALKLKDNLKHRKYPLFAENGMLLNKFNTTFKRIPK